MPRSTRMYARRIPAVLAALALTAGGLTIATAPAQASPPSLDRSESSTATPAAKAKKKTSLKLTAIKNTAGGSIVSGKSIRLYGKASTNLKGQRVIVQRKASGKWIAAGGAAKVKSNGTFAVNSTAAGVGAVSYRVLFKSTGGLKSAASSKTAVVWKWFNLTDLQLADSTNRNLYTSDSISVAGKRYSKLLRAYERSSTYESWTDYNLSYKCQSFSTLVGPTDTSDSGAVAYFRVALDGNDVGDSVRHVGLGQAHGIELDVTNKFRIRLYYSNNNVDVSPAWPAAKILCKGKP